MVYQTAQSGRKLTSEALVGILILEKSRKVRILLVWTSSECLQRGRVLKRWQAQMSLTQSLKYEVRVSGKPGVNPSSLPLKEAKGSCLFSGTWRLLWHLYSLLSHGREAPSPPDGRQQKQLHKQFKSRLLSGDFSLDPSLTLTPDISPQRSECLMSPYSELSPSVQLPLFTQLSFFLYPVYPQKTFGVF